MVLYKWLGMRRVQLNIGDNDGGWKNAVRHTLTKRNLFEKLKDPDSRGYFIWLELHCFTGKK